MPSVENRQMFYRRRFEREFGGHFVLITDGLSDFLTGTFIAFPGVEFHDRTSKSTLFVALPFLIHKLFALIPRPTES